MEQGYKVVAFDRYNPNNHWGWLEESEYRNDMEVILGDVRDYDSVFRALEGCNAVFHLAALIGIPYSYVSPLAYIRTNVEGTYNVLESARSLEVDQVLITSTSETYGTAQYVPIDEEHPLVGQSPYSASKIGADQLALSYHKSFDLPIKVVRPFNTYGPRQSSRSVIPTIICQNLKGSGELQLGNLEPTRDLTYVKDTCTAFLEIFQAPEFYGEVTNIGMNIEVSIGDLVAEINQLMGVDLTIVKDQQRVRPYNSEVERLVCSNKKLRSYTSWQPQYSLQSGLQETIIWYRERGPSTKAEIYHV